jgi:nitric oxide reductase NorE protein
MGIHKDSPSRIYAAILYQIEQMANETGSTYSLLHEVHLKTLELLDIDLTVNSFSNYLKELNRNKSRSFLLLGIVFGLAFLVLKSFEYSEKISQGYTSSFNAFFTFYWFLTFFHFMHVLFVTGILTFLFFKLKKESEGEVYALEVGGALWHMCDLIWILLFPTLFYIR